MMKEVFVAHPGLQHAHQLAWALHEQGLLQAFWSGVPIVAPGEALPYWFPRSFAQRLKQVPIPREFRRHPVIFPLLLQLRKVLPQPISGEEYMHRLCHWFDLWVSRHIERINPKIVVGYENAAYHTFMAAKRIGAKCVLDAASLHYSVSRRLRGAPETLFSSQIDGRKDVEIELADFILTCSPLATESYIAAGVLPTKVQPILLGANLPEHKTSFQPHQRPLKFIFAGTLRYLKAVDVILTVFRRLHSEQISAEIIFVGGLAERDWLEEIRQTPNAIYRPSVTQKDLYGLLGESDCLLLPSRFDSFGMVVAEAMACGTPAIVSKQTGAKAIIEQFPKSGWIIDCGIESLHRCIRERIENREALFAARSYAHQAAAHFTWQAYRQRVAKVFQAISKP